ncbi:hypothetical protein D9M72_409730 [compost metagenome]
MLHSLPAAKQALGPKPAMVDPVRGPSPDAHHPAALDGDVASAAVAAENTGGLHPLVDVACLDARLQRRVYAVRPKPAAGVGCAGAPDVGNTVNHELTSRK